MGLPLHSNLLTTEAKENSNYISESANDIIPFMSTRDEWIMSAAASLCKLTWWNNIEWTRIFILLIASSGYILTLWCAIADMLIFMETYVNICMDDIVSKEENLQSILLAPNKTLLFAVLISEDCIRSWLQQNEPWISACKYSVLSISCGNFYIKKNHKRRTIDHA